MRNIDVFFKYPHLIFYIIAGVTLFVAILNFHSSILVKDYQETTGEICNLESEEELRRGRYVTRYSYDIVWYADGEEYVKHLDGQTDSIEEGTRTIWVHPDNKDVVLSNSVEMRADVPIELLVAVVTYVIGTIIYKNRYNEKKMSRSKLKEHLEDTRLYSMLLFILTVIGIIMFTVMNYMDYKKGNYVRETMFDIVIMFVVIAIICLVKFFKAGGRLKKL